MWFHIPLELLALMAVGALVGTLLEEGFGDDGLSRLVAHLVSAALVIVVWLAHRSTESLSMSSLIGFLTSRLTLFFAGISAVVASALEVVLKRHALLRSVAHFVGMLVAVVLLD
ncbi:MAG: hypothetical protein FJ026_04030 [Chloroflexi bacterium]|nr:hypothetical protein [Chloroflexota bacterium]